MADDDLGFVCKACGKFYTTAAVKDWDTRWETHAAEKVLAEIIHRCPLCQEVRGYVPNESVLRFEAEGVE
jgi:hypothetical protein